MGGEGETPVGESCAGALSVFPSSAEPVEFRVNLPGPPGKPKDSLVTDSAEYREGMVKSTPGGE